MYVKEPKKIESTSMDIVDGYLGDVDFKEDELPIVKRIIHTSGDPEYRKIITFQNNFIKAAKESLEKSPVIYTDTNMIKAGINKGVLERSGIEVLTLVSNEDIVERAKETGLTRSILAIEEGVARGAKVFVIGNAPTALFRLLELTDEGKVNPDFIIGVPVGFVGAAESKEELRQRKIPAVSTVGYKGGSNIAASVVNALLYEVFGR